jgi:RNA polymerase sigma-70 factor (ECF subfamily)
MAVTDDLEPSDAELIRRLRSNDARAFDEVYRRYHARVYGFLVRLTGRRAVADDLAQETWLRVARHAGTIRDDVRLAPWIFAIARNLTLSQRRREGVHAHAFADVAGETVDGLDVVSPFDRLAAAELEDSLEAALASLAPSYREVLLLVGIEGMTPQEAAIALGLKPDAARQRLARARAMVEDYLARAARTSRVVSTPEVR